MASCMIAITVVSALYDEQLKLGIMMKAATGQVTTGINNESASYAILALLCLFIAMFAASWYVTKKEQKKKNSVAYLLSLGERLVGYILPKYIHK